MAVTITVAELANVLGNYNVPDYTPGTDPTPIIVQKAERLLPIASALVEEYCRGSACPGAVMNEAVVRVSGWLNSMVLSTGIKSQKVDDLEVEYFASQRSALKNSGAESLLTRFKQRRGGLIMWPFTKSEKIEIRQANSFTDAVVQNIVAGAAGTLQSNPQTIAALEIACGAFQRAFQGCSVEGSPMVKEVLTAAVLGNIARELIRRGESIYLINVFAGELELLPVGSWDIQSEGITESEWQYRIDVFGPSGNITRLVPSSSICHFKYSYLPERPYCGIPPLGHASTTGNLAANLEEKLKQETNMPVGAVIPMPIDSAPKEDGTGALDGLRKDLPNLKGQIALVETTSGGWGEGKIAAPMSGDWQSKRIGADPPEVLQVLRSDVGRSILAACGVNPVLFDGTGSSQGQREAYRQFYQGSVMPLAALVSEELSRKLETEVTLNFTEAQAHDIAARSTSFKKMVEAGMDANKAAGISGLVSLEVE